MVKLGNRNGDAAPMAILELVDYNDVANKKAEEHKAKRELKAKDKADKKGSDGIEEATVVEEKTSKKSK